MLSIIWGIICWVVTIFLTFYFYAKWSDSIDREFENTIYFKSDYDSRKSCALFFSFIGAICVVQIVCALLGLEAYYFIINIF